MLIKEAVHRAAGVAVAQIQSEKADYILILYHTGSP